MPGRTGSEFGPFEQHGVRAAELGEVVQRTDADHAAAITTTRACDFIPDTSAPECSNGVRRDRSDCDNDLYKCVSPSYTALRHRKPGQRRIWVKTDGATRSTRYAFLTLADYSMIAVTNAVEPLRMANRVSGRPVYDWRVVTLDGRPVAASNGLMLTPTESLHEVGALDLVFVCGGVNVREAVSPALVAALRRLAVKRMPLGALCTGGYALAQAGLLDGFRATIHWENLSALREQFPRVLIDDHVFTIDRDRYTCSGGVAPLELMLKLIEQKLGPQVSRRVSEQFILERIRDGSDRQYVPLRAQVGVAHRSVLAVAALMEASIENPLSLEGIARQSGLSRRQIERLFKQQVNCVPKRYYIELRLKRARELLLQTSMPVAAISTACGFQSPPHFSKCYRNHFGHPPTAERQPRRRSAAQ